MADYSFVSGDGNTQQKRARRSSTGRKKSRRKAAADDGFDSGGEDPILGGSSDSDSDDLEMESFLEGESTVRRRSRAGTLVGVRTMGDRVVMSVDGTGMEERDDDEPVVLTKAERKIADLKVLREIAISGIFVGLWYIFSLLISIYNKWMFSPEHLNFHFPLFVTSGHMLVQFSLSSLVLFAFPHLRPGHHLKHGHHHHAHHASRSEPESEPTGRTLIGTSRAEERKKQQQGIMTPWFYLSRLFPCGAATGLDIGLGNMSLKFISLTFYTMCKSSSLAFVLIFAFMFKLEKPTWRLLGIISVMTVGVVMMVAGEVHFSAIGFILVITAAALSGLRWSLMQVLLMRNPATGNPFSSIFFLAPIMFVSIFAIAVPVEGFGPLWTSFWKLSGEWGFIPAVGILVFPGVIAFLMVSSEFALLKRTSVITLSICGIFKEVITISAAAIVFHDKLTPVNISGLIVTIFSIAAYNYIKVTRMRRDAAEEVAGQQAYVAVGAEDESDDEDRRRRVRQSVDEGVQAGDGRVYESDLLGTRNSVDEGVQVGNGQIR